MQKSATADISTPHLKWKQVSTACAPALPGGWKYYKVIDDICGIRSTSFARAAGLLKSTTGKTPCSSFDKAAGLCK
jgi:hypothetical protein